MNDPLSFLASLKRYADVGATVTGLAARIIAEKNTPYQINDTAYAQTLKEALGKMKGPFMKVAQFLSTIPHAIPPEYAAVLSDLQSNAPPMSPFFVKRRMQTELGPDWQKHFQHFNIEPSFAASLGQVHKATDLDGQTIAVKLQYPNMESVVNTDLNQLSFLIGAYKLFNQALDLNQVIDEIRQRLYEELDYRNEAKNLNDYCVFFKDRALKIHVPSVVEPLSTNRLLTMTWSEGVSIFDYAKNITQDEKNELGRLLFLSWYQPFYLKGWIHGDPHPGNYLMHADGTLHLLDFGCIRRFDTTFIDAVINLYHALKNNDKALEKEAYAQWGFINMNDDVVDIMHQWAQFLYAPLLDDRIRPIQPEFSNDTGWNTASQIHEKLNAAGGITVPKEFVFMDRASVGIGSVLMRLGCQLNWHQLFEELLDERRMMRGG